MATVTVTTGNRDGRMLLYTAQPRRRARGGDSVADRMGLSDRLGYRPMFCIPVSEGSLEDFWFRAWSASPGRPERILLIETGGAEPVPMDAIAWTNAMGRHGSGAGDGRAPDFDRILREGDPDATDYLLPPGGKGYAMREVPVWPDAGSLAWADAFGRDAPAMRDRVAGIRGACVRKIASGAVACDGRVSPSVTCGAMYGMLTYSAMIPILWSLVTGRTVMPPALWIVPQTFEGCYEAIDRAQVARQAWDDSIPRRTETDVHLIRLMRRDFASALASALASVISDYATARGLGPDDPCPCGSGRGIMECHGTVASVDDAIVGEAGFRPCVAS